ncbi:hypothetical protein [Parashewanella hymeniacidonis]|uniref:hypothetical protein n=1 Tax=Parashewanella hymeniacidonis TaxID=2807618 RepID=UPI001EF51019|nr:hypothetical protein [Parashewanella hymeniacidonis]
MDEPFSNVDSHLKLNIMTEIKSIFLEQGVTAIFVTHSKEEADVFADSIVEMRDGKLITTS